MSYDVEALRAQFPILAETGRNGQPLVYLDNAASTQRPLAVLDAVDHYERHAHANVHRAVHVLSQRATEAYEAGRAQLAAFLNAPSPDEVVFTRGTTEALNLVAYAWGGMLAPGDEVVLTALEHHSNIVPWQLVAARTGAVIRVVPIHDDGSLDLDAYDRLLGPRTKIVSVGHTSNALGTVNPVAEMAARAHAVGAILVVDGAQGAPHAPIDVQALGADFFALSGHKMYGPTGIGALWGRMELLERMPPWQGGGDMIETVRFEGSTWAAPPARFEAGTPYIAGAVGIGAAARFLMDVGRDAVSAHEARLLARATAGLQSLDGVRILGTAPHKAAVLSFVVDGLHPTDVGTFLDEDGIAVRTGHHCAQPLMERLGVEATARASFGLYNTEAEVDRFLTSMAKIVRLFR
ncbi:MAG: cysteine desulfurase [Myxococcales bacterium]|nr:cysteine desulfurase [Myxococcales bacterium]MCB9669138.1 cysteine desulfurase [Alphaproteobacteria bacterium]MCB9692971.1 cysteine desulfurase [Alphaproteobacteria bacterium]